MAAAWFGSLTLKELRLLAEKEGIKHIKEYDFSELVEVLEEVFEEKHAELLQNNDVMLLKGKKYDIFRERPFCNVDETYELPDLYADTKVRLLLRDPYWAFAYWDIHQLDLLKVRETNPSLELFLRVYELFNPEDPVDQALSSFEIPVQEVDTSWYINLPNPNRVYRVDLFCDCMKDSGEIFLMARSNAVESPGGYWLDHADELRSSPQELELFLAGLSDPSGSVTDNPLVEKILEEAAIHPHNVNERKGY
ncbi:MAG: DUF4912 domain-containing protein [Spirochaetota bacterium]